MAEEKDVKSLKYIISDKAKSIRNKILKTKKVEPGEFEEITRLDTVIKICEDSKITRKGKLLTIASLFIIVAVVTASMFVKKKRTQVQMNLITTRLEFCLEDGIMLAESIFMQEMGIGELSKIDFPRTLDLKGVQAVNSDNGNFTVKIFREEDEVQKGTITLNNVYLPQKSRIILSTTELENHYRLYLEVPETETLNLNASILGKVILAYPNKSIPITSESPKTIVLFSAENYIDIDFIPSKNSPVTFLPVLCANKLSFCREEYYSNSDGVKKVTISDLISGTLNISTLKDEGLQFHNKDILQFKRIFGKIGALQLSNNKIMLNFTGEAEGITTDMNQSLMPSLLEFYSTHHRFKLIWAAVLFIFTLGKVGLKWFTGR